MSIYRLVDRLRVRRMVVDDIPRRVALLADPAVMRNIVDVAAVQSAATIEKGNRDRLAQGWTNHLDYVFENEADELLGFAWLSNIDWISRRCETSLAMLPEHRGGLGRLCHVAMLRHTVTVLNLEASFNQVYESNGMMNSASRNAERASVVGYSDVFVAGEWRNCFGWVETPEDVRAGAAK